MISWAVSGLHQHLIEQGYKRIGHMAGPQNLQTYLHRKNGYIEALSKNGISLMMNPW